MNVSGPTLAAAFATATARFPDHLAVTDGHTTLTYRELADRVAELSAVIRERTSTLSGRIPAVGLCAERTVELIVGMLAILDAGLSYVPLAPDHPVERLKSVVDQLDLAVIVCDGASASVARRLAPVRVDTRAKPTSDVRAIAPGADDLAYVLFTSGSTGKPKGVLIEHRNVLALLAGCEEIIEFGERDVWSMAHSYAFDFSVWEIWGALAYGGLLVVLPNDVVRDPEAFWNACVAHRVTVWNATPSYFLHVATAVDRRLPEGALRHVILGGETLNPPSLRAFFNRYAESGRIAPTLVNMYGITETTVFVTAQRMTPAMVDETASIIGVALPHLAVSLLDEHRLPVADGETGEIYVSGAGLARGYVRAPELTSDRFVIDPVTGQRSYRSGDLARSRPDGRLEYLGRIDSQVKVRGFRVELAEIEGCLLRHDGVRQAAVTQRQDDPDGSLIGYYVADQPVDPAAIKVYLAQRLPGYLVPATLCQLAELPRTGNGKLDLAALETVPADPVAVPSPTSAAGLDAWLAAAWRDALDMDDVAEDDDFFAVGGNSLMAMRLIRRCREAGVPFKVADLYQYPTLRELTGLLSDRGEQV